MSTSRPYSIKMFIPDGNPENLRIIERTLWTGACVVFRRGCFSDVQRLPEFRRTGIYVLVGSSEESTLPMVYIGQGEDVGSRLIQHYSKKDFWDWGLFFVTKDNELTGTHAKYIESQLIDRAKQAKQCKLDNGVSSLPPTMPRADVADMDNFLDYIYDIVPLVGLQIFHSTEKVETVTPQDLLYLGPKSGTPLASGYEDARGFVVAKGSNAKRGVGKLPAYLNSLRDDLINLGVLEKMDDGYTFAQNYAFNSPSAAAGICTGYSVSGRNAWKNADGESLNDLDTETAETMEEEEEIEYLFDYHLEDKSEEIQELVQQIQAFVYELDDEIEEVPVKHYIAYKSASRNIVCVKPQMNSIKLFVDLKPVDIQQPPSSYRDVTNVGHHGTGNTQFRVQTQADFEEIKQYVELAYQNASEEE